MNRPLLGRAFIVVVALSLLFGCTKIEVNCKDHTVKISAPEGSAGPSGAMAMLANCPKEK